MHSARNELFAVNALVTANEMPEMSFYECCTSHSAMSLKAHCASLSALAYKAPGINFLLRFHVMNG